MSDEPASLSRSWLSVDATRWDSIAPLCHELFARRLTAEAVPAWLQHWSDLYKAVLESRARLKADAIRSPHDEAAQAAFRTCQEEVMPRWMAAKEELTNKLLAVDGFRPGPEHHQMMRRLHNQHGLFTEASVSLDAELSALEGEFGALVASLRAQTGGETVSLAVANARLTDLERTMREAAWRAITDAWLGRREERGGSRGRTASRVPVPAGQPR